MDPSSARTIPRLLTEAAEAYGDAHAIEDGDVTLTFDELAAAAREAAAGFIAAGIEPGDRAAIWAPNIYEWVLAALGLHIAGGVLVPINTRYKGSEAAYILRKSRARLLFCVSGFLGFDYVAMLDGEALSDLERIVVLRGGADDGTHSWDDFVLGGAGVDEATVTARAASVGEDDVSDILFTSGTTGNPKGVMTAHGQNLRTFESWSGIVGLRAGDRYLVVNPFFHSFGYKAGWLSALMRGATTIPHAVFDADAVLARISDEKISMLPGPPTLYQSILAHPDLGDHDLSSLRLAVTGAAAIPVSLIERMRGELQFETVLTAYGLTEVCGVATISRPGDTAETIATTSGRAIPDVEVRCAGDDGEEVPCGEPGEVVVRGYNVMAGYFEDADETAEAIDADGWLHTGDIGVMDSDGNLQITDRKKDMFISGGFNCYPAEIENLMLANEDLVQVAVIGVPDERMGEVGAAYVVAKPDAATTDDELRDWCRERMANFKVPRQFRIVDALPMTATGKVQKFKLRDEAVP